MSAFFSYTVLLGYPKGIGNWKLVFPHHLSFSVFKVGTHISMSRELHNCSVINTNNGLPLLRCVIFYPHVTDKG